jgi:hypothetical protein
MISSRLRQLAADYITAWQAQEQDPTSEELEARRSEAHEQFIVQLDVEGIRYFDHEDADRIAAGIMEGFFDVLYHKCGRAIILDGETFRIHGGGLAGHAIEICPECGQRLDAFDLYPVSGGPVHGMLRQAGLYPTADSLVLMADPEQRATILRELRESLGDLSDGDLLAVYAVVVALIKSGDDA